MIKLLHSSFLLVFLLIANLGYSQSKCTHQHFLEGNDQNISLDAESFFHETSIKTNTKVFSYNFDINEAKQPYLYQNMDHDHQEELVLIDIISSDEGTDFNCSGGFCMNKLHYHKKGLTLKRQFFGYFMSITC